MQISRTLATPFVLLLLAGSELKATEPESEPQATNPAETNQASFPNDIETLFLNTDSVTNRPRVVALHEVPASVPFAFNDLPGVALEAAGRHLSSSVPANNDRWSLEFDRMHRLNGRHLVVLLKQTFLGHRIEHGEIRVTFLSPSNSIAEVDFPSATELPPDILIRRVSGIIWSDMAPLGSDMPVVAQNFESEACSILGYDDEACTFDSIETRFDPVERAFFRRLLLENGDGGDFSADGTVLLRRNRPDGNFFDEAEIRHYTFSATADDSVSVVDNDEWIEVIGPNGSGQCFATLGIPGATWGIQRVILNGGLPASDQVGCSQASSDPVFSSCSGSSCIWNSRFRQQTSYVWVKKARDQAKAYGYSQVSPLYPDDVTVEVDSGSAACFGADACYTHTNRRIFLKAPAYASWRTYQFEPFTVAHEYGHHFQFAYTTNVSQWCYSVSHAKSIREGVATLFGALTLKANRADLQYGHRSSLGLQNDRYHFNSTNRVQLPASCSDPYDFADAFEQAWYEVLYNENCYPLGCSSTRTNGTTGGLGWSSMTEARSTIVEAMATAFLTEGVGGTWVTFSHAMVDAIEDMGYPASLTNNISAIMGHHGL